MEKLLAILILSISFSTASAKEYTFDCSPIDDALSFRIKGVVKSHLKKPYLGLAHSYAFYGELKKTSGCRTPWYEKFQLKGVISGGLIQHSHEYTKGCYFKLIIPTRSGEGRMWVKRNNLNEDSTIVRTSCEIIESN